MLRKVVAQDILRLVERERITVLLGVPSIYNLLVNEPTIGTFDLTSLRRAVSGGAPASPSLIRAMEEKLGCLCMVGYGLTETAPLLSKALPKAHLGGTAPRLSGCPGNTRTAVASSGCLPSSPPRPKKRQ